MAGRARLLEHPLAFGSLRSWLRLLVEHGPPDARYLPRALAVTLSSALTAPLRAYESLRYGRALARAEVHPSPVFIIGHWRTGTTHLHNLLCRDPELGYVSTFQAFAPGLALVGERRLKPALDAIARRLHPTREIDNIPMSMDNPEEEDLAVANLSPYSYLHMYTFPRHAEAFFERFVTAFEDLPDAVRARWADAYLQVLRKATLASGGKRLVIKNCADGARIPTLLKLFPDARFIHIHRNPYDVFRSTRRLYEVVLHRSQVQRLEARALEEWVLGFYEGLMRRLFDDLPLIPPGRLAQVRYEDLDREPLPVLRRVYDDLGLPGFARAEPAVRSYLDGLGDYRKNVYRADDDAIAKVNARWGFALEALGYERLEPTA